MPEQEVRLRELREMVAARLNEKLTKALSDHRQIALSYEAQIQAQDQQIGALRAEQARLRAENADYQHSFELYSKASRSLMEAYKQAHPEVPENVWPDATKVNVWAAREITALRAENERLTAGWQPIETAPKDGRTILLFKRTPPWSVYGYGRFESFAGISGWLSYGFGYDSPGNLGLATPSHWMAIPEAPST